MLSDIEMDDSDSSPALCVLEIDPIVLHLWAFDTLAIPAMSVEYERVFTSTKKLITTERSRLYIDIIKVSECLKN